MVRLHLHIWPCLGTNPGKHIFKFFLIWEACLNRGWTVRFMPPVLHESYGPIHATGSTWTERSVGPYDSCHPFYMNRAVQPWFKGFTELAMMPGSWSLKNQISIRFPVNPIELPGPVQVWKLWLTRATCQHFWVMEVGGKWCNLVRCQYTNHSLAITFILSMF